MNKTSQVVAIILLIVIFSFASLSLGIYIGKKSESNSMAEYIKTGKTNKDSTALQELRNTVLMEVEEKLGPILGPQFAPVDLSEQEINTISGDITKIENQKIKISTPARTLKDILWQEGEIEYEVTINEDTIINIFAEKDPANLGLQEIKLPDGTTIQEPEPPFSKSEGSIDDLSENSRISVTYKKSDQNNYKITALEITLYQSLPTDETLRPESPEPITTQ